ncbi:MAG: DinB family protein [Gemmatimonadota bacterium]
MSTPPSSRPADGEYNPYYAGYVGLVPDGDVRATLRTQITDTAALLLAAPANLHEHRYAAGKWSVKEVVAHMADTERVMAYRILRFARGDGTPLASFDEQLWAPAAGCEMRTLPSLVAEFEAVRAATSALLQGLPPEAWTRGGQASGAAVTVRALAWIIAGHELHHRTLLEARYLAPMNA